MTDIVTKSFGIRTLRWGQEGLLLNERKVKIRGYVEEGNTGAQDPASVQKFTLKMLKDMGCNAWRTSGHSPTKDLLDQADKLGY